MIFNLEGTGVEYTTAMNLSIFPKNNMDDVNRFCAKFGIEPNQHFAFQLKDGQQAEKWPFPTPCTFETALTRFVDLTSYPSASILGFLINHTTDESEQAALRHLTQEPSYLTVLDIFEKFPSINVELADVL